MARKALFIVFLISLLVAFFYYRPLFGQPPEEPDLIDRVPEGDFLGKVNLMELARESNLFLFFNKLPMRDFFSPEFLLAQGKNYGLDIQRSAYFFANESGEWGALLSVTDSSKVYPGILRLKKDFPMTDTIVENQRIHVFQEEGMYLTYGKRWLFVYKGDQMPKRMYHVLYARKGDISRSWKAFERQDHFREENLVLYSNSRRFREKGFKVAMFAHDSDSLSLSVKTYFESIEPLSVREKDSALAFRDKSGTDKLLNVHLDISEFRKQKSDPLYRWLVKLGSRISFPVEAFFDAWEGDISFYQGGIVSVRESYVEFMMDENFNATEVKRQREIKVPGFAFAMSTNKNQKEFISRLFAKGIMRKENKKFYVLTSPPLKIRTTPTHLFLYSSETMPGTELSDFNGGYWSHEGIRYGFSLDSLRRKEIFGTIRVPAARLLRQNRFF